MFFKEFQFGRPVPPVRAHRVFIHCCGLSEGCSVDVLGLDLFSPLLASLVVDQLFVLLLVLLQIVERLTQPHFDELALLVVVDEVFARGQLQVIVLSQLLFRQFRLLDLLALFVRVVHKTFQVLGLVVALVSHFVVQILFFLQNVDF